MTNNFFKEFVNTSSMFKMTPLEKSTKDVQSVKKYLYMIGLKMSYLAFSIFCINYLRLIFNFINEIMFGWSFIVLFSFVQIQYPEMSENIIKITNSIVDLIQAFFRIFNIVIEALLTTFKNTPYKIGTDKIHSN